MEWNVPSSGELILMITEPNVLLTWVFGPLLVDRRVRPSSFTLFAMEFRGPAVSAHDSFVMKEPLLQIQFYNGWGKNTQSVQMESADSVVVSENIYDFLGRPAIKTKRPPSKRIFNELLPA